MLEDDPWELLLNEEKKHAKAIENRYREKWVGYYKETTASPDLAGKVKDIRTWTRKAIKEWLGKNERKVGKHTRKMVTSGVYSEFQIILERKLKAPKDVKGEYSKSVVRKYDLIWQISVMEAMEHIGKLVVKKFKDNVYWNEGENTWAYEGDAIATGEYMNSLDYFVLRESKEGATTRSEEIVLGFYSTCPHFDYVEDGWGPGINEGDKNGRPSIKRIAEWVASEGKRDLMQDVYDNAKARMGPGFKGPFFSSRGELGLSKMFAQSVRFELLKIQRSIIAYSHPGRYFFKDALAYYVSDMVDFSGDLMTRLDREVHIRFHNHWRKSGEQGFRLDIMDTVKPLRHPSERPRPVTRPPLPPELREAIDMHKETRIRESAKTSYRAKSMKELESILAKRSTGYGRGAVKRAKERKASGYFEERKITERVSYIREREVQPKKDNTGYKKKRKTAEEKAAEDNAYVKAAFGKTDSEMVEGYEKQVASRVAASKIERSNAARKAAEVRRRRQQAKK